LCKERVNSKEIRYEIASLLSRVEILELGNIPMMLSVSAIVHPEEAEDKEQERHEGLGNHCECYPCDELPEIVCACHD